MYLMLSTKAITLLIYALLSHIFSMKKNFRCATLSVFDYIVLLTKNSAAGRTAHLPAKWRSISFPEVLIQSETGKSYAKCQSKMFELNFRSYCRTTMIQRNRSLEISFEMRRNVQGKYNINMCTVRQTLWL